MEDGAALDHNEANGEENENNLFDQNEINEVEVNHDDEDEGDDDFANNDNVIDAEDGDNNNGVLDGGVAANVNHLRSADCPMVSDQIFRGMHLHFVVQAIILTIAVTKQSYSTLSVS
jgi:hypothetical protein